MTRRQPSTRDKIGIDMGDMRQRDLAKVHPILVKHQLTRYMIPYPQSSLSLVSFSEDVAEYAGR